MAFMVTYNEEEEEEEEGEEGEGERITQGMCLPRAIAVYVFSVVSMQLVIVNQTAALSLSVVVMATLCWMPFSY